MYDLHRMVLACMVVAVSIYAVRWYANPVHARYTYAYIMAKAAALLATTKFAVKLQDEGFIVITLCPGMVDCSATAGADSAALANKLKEFSASAEKNTRLEVTRQTPGWQSVAAQLKVIDGLQASHNGLCLQHTGGEYFPRR